jgi:hypothetical protein
MVQNERNACSDVYASFEFGSAFDRTQIHVLHVYQTTEKKLNVSVFCYSCEQPSAHIVDLLSHMWFLFLAQETKPSKIFIDSFFIVLLFYANS